MIHRMLRSPRFLLTGLALFLMGMVTDRIVVHFFAPRTVSENDEEGIPGRKGESAQASSSLRNPARSYAVTGDEEQQANQSRSDPRQENESPVPQSIREALDSLERGGQMDAETTNGLLSQVPAGHARREVLHRLANYWAKLDPQAAAAWASALEGSDRRHALEAVLHSWADADPAAAANYVVQLPVSEQNLHLVHAMGHKWAESDHAAAMRWALIQADPSLRGRAMGGVVSSWSDTDPAGAAAFAASIESQFERKRVLEVAARRWASKDPVEALEWAQALPAEDRQQTIRAILRELAERDPTRAAAAYQDLTAALPAEPQSARDFRHMAQEIASLWSSTAPREAAVWSTQLPEGAIRHGAVASVAEQWLQIDPVAAGEWILQLPEGSTRDAGAERIVEATMQSDPAVAFQWAGSISDQGHRTGMMREVLDQWKASDPDSALAALANATVSPAQRNELNRLFGEVAPPQQTEAAEGQQ